jgi:hypothetical protein
MRDFTRTNHLQLLDLANPNSRYFWTTWRKRPVPPLPNAGAEPVIRRVTNAWTFERAIPNSGPLAGVAAWIENIPAEADLNNLEFAIDGARTAAVYIGAPDERGLQQLNAWITKSLRTGLLPVELYWSGKRLGPPATARVIPAGPPVPRIISVTDGLNIGERNRSTTGSLKIILNAAQAPERPQILVGGRPAAHVSTRCIDSLAPLHEVDIDLPSELAPGRHLLELRIGRRALPAEVEVVRRPGV